MAVSRYLPFTANKWQVTTYLLGVALFSISFLVFLNSVISFVITDLIGQKHKTGDAVGTLGFADELVALVACPVWGLVSDRIGVRWVCTIGYAIVGLSLFVLVQAQTVYPQLLLARLLFSVGGAATATMVTAVLPAMTTQAPAKPRAWTDERERLGSASTEHTITPQGFGSHSGRNPYQSSAVKSAERTSQVAGLVGMFTGIGALVALGAFLPLPTYFQKVGQSKEMAVVHAFYVVGAVALCVSLACFFGLRNLAGEDSKGLKRAIPQNVSPTSHLVIVRRKPAAFAKSFFEALRLGFSDPQISLGYIGGFVARASSVGVSLFIPLFINAYFISSGKCKDRPSSDPSEVKEHCQAAYRLAAALTGTAELFALLFAPVFGYVEGKFRRSNIPLIIASLCGIIGYSALANVRNPEPKVFPAVFGIMALVGISQIGAIVCSLSVLGRGIQGFKEETDRPLSQAQGDAYENGDRDSDESEESPLISTAEPVSREHVKGAIAGVYSFGGGVGILLLTKLGGSLFDKLSPGAPFYMMAIYNAMLLIAGLGSAFFSFSRYGKARSRQPDGPL